MKKKRGRPEKEAGTTKDVPLQIRADTAERDAFYAAAKLSGLTFSAWARERLRAVSRKELKSAGESIPFLP